MKKTKILILSFGFILGTLGCGSSNHDVGRADGNRVYQSAGDTTRRDTRVIRGEERTIDSANWREAKSLLSREGYNPGSIDPVDQQTRDAIASYQRRHKINATGLLDSRTLIYMQRDGAGFSGTLGAQLEKADVNSNLNAE